MNRVVRRELSAADLPEMLRGDIDPTHRVRVVVEDLDGIGAKRTASAQRILALAGAAAEMDTSIEEAVERIRAIRDEWD